VFDVAVGERAISHAGHIKMMGAVQPFLSGAISKTVNMPQTASVEDIAEAYVQAWKLGVKALAIYRDGSKTAQALRTDAQDSVDSKAAAALATGEEMFTAAEVEARVAAAVEAAVSDAVAAVAAEPGPARRKMPRERESITHKFSIGGHEGYITAGMYEDGTVGEIFLTDIGKEGSTLRGMMNSFATAISIALQYGVPLETLVQKFAYMRFEPEGSPEPGDPVREVDARLHHALAGVALPGRRVPGGARDPHAGRPRQEGGEDLTARRRTAADRARQNRRRARRSPRAAPGSTSPAPRRSRRPRRNEPPPRQWSRPA
jgi:hypothetical protein